MRVTLPQKPTNYAKKKEKEALTEATHIRKAANRNFTLNRSIIDCITQ